MLNITLNTFKEIIRNKFLYVIIFFWIVFILFSLILSEITIWDASKIIIDFGLATIEIFWLIWVLFIGSQLLFKEIEWKTIFLILSKPIKRSDFIIGKFLWFSIVVFLILFFEAILFLGMLFFREIEISNLVIWSLINSFLKLEIVLSLVFFFSSFMWSFMTIIVTVLIYLLWHSYSLVLNLAYKWENTFIIYLSKWIWILFPQFEALNTKDLIWNFTNLSNTLLFTNLSVSLLYIAVLIILTNLIFSKKTFE